MGKLIKRSFSVLDLIGLLIAAAVVGYYSQRSADSGGFYPEQIARAIFHFATPLPSFYLYLKFMRPIEARPIRWYIFGIAGSLLSAIYVDIGARFIFPLFESLFRGKAFFVEYLANQAGGAIAGAIFHGILLSVVFLAAAFPVRLAFCLIDRPNRGEAEDRG